MVLGKIIWVRDPVFLEICRESPPGLLLVQDGKPVHTGQRLSLVVGHRGLVLHQRVGQGELDRGLEVSLGVRDVADYAGAVLLADVLQVKTLKTAVN